MRVRLAYGRSGLEIEVPRERTTVIEPVQAPVLADPDAALTAALRAPVAGPPLRQLARPGQTVAISVCDITRAQPRREMIGAVLRELDGVVRPEDVTILIATGTHRANTPAELRAMLGEEILGACRVINHDARDDSSLVDLGRAAKPFRPGSPVTGWRRTCGSRPDSSSRTSSPGSRAARRWSPLGSPGWTRCSPCTTPSGSAIRARPGGSSTRTDAQRHPGDRGAAGSEAAHER